MRGRRRRFSRRPHQCCLPISHRRFRCRECRRGASVIPNAVWCPKSRLLSSWPKRRRLKSCHRLRPLEPHDSESYCLSPVPLHPLVHGPSALHPPLALHWFHIRPASITASGGVGERSRAPQISIHYKSMLSTGACGWLGPTAGT
jgi:hypothetical protein